MVNPYAGSGAVGQFDDAVTVHVDVVDVIAGTAFRSD
jgi:hypothetical protein